MNERNERGAWAPVVGVALALVTAGSLTVFAMVAQRATLDGFSPRGVTARSGPSSAGAITLPPPGSPEGSSDAADGSSDAAEAALSFETPTTTTLDPAPPTTVAVIATGRQTASGPTRTSGAGDTSPTTTNRPDPTGSGRTDPSPDEPSAVAAPEPGVFSFFRGGSTDSDASGNSRCDRGKHKGDKHATRGKGHDKAKCKDPRAESATQQTRHARGKGKGKGKDKAETRSPSRSPHGRPASASDQHGSSDPSERPMGHRRSRPTPHRAASSGPAPRSHPAQPSRSAGKSNGHGNSKSNGHGNSKSNGHGNSNGHGKSRGRGHGR